MTRKLPAQSFLRVQRSLSKTSINFFKMFIFLYLCLAVLAFVAASRGCSVQASHCSGFSCCEARALECMGFINCGSQALEQGLSNCDAQVSLLRGVWNLPGSGIEPVSPALAGGFSTTEAPGKPRVCFLIYLLCMCIHLVKISMQHDSVRFKKNPKLEATHDTCTVRILSSLATSGADGLPSATARPETRLCQPPTALP